MSVASSPRERRFASTLVLGMLIAIVLVAMSDCGRSSMLLRGDFPGFYAPAVIVHSGQEAALYDLELQRRVENESWPRSEGQFFISAYPPYVARLLEPLAFLDAIPAKLVATALLAACFIAGLGLLRQTNAAFAARGFPDGVYAFVLAPVATGVLAAQNTALSLLAICIAWAGLRERSPRGEYIAGAALGAWMFKPQYALIALVLVGCCARRPRVLVGALPVGVLYWCLGASVLGPAWITKWIAAAGSFGALNYDVNGHQMVSLAGGLHALGSWLGLPPGNFRGVGNLAAMALLAGAASLMFRAGSDRSGTELANLFPFVGPVIALAAPQTLFYDLGFCLPAFLVLLPVETRSRQFAFAATTALCGVALAARSPVGFPWFFVLALALLAGCVRAALALPRTIRLPRGRVAPVAER